jgi:hypothetical protein
MNPTTGVWLDVSLVIRIFFLGGIGMSLFLIFASELKGGAPGLNSIFAGLVTFVYILRGKHRERDESLHEAIQSGREFISNVIKMTLVGMAAAALSTILLVLAFRFGYLIDTTCWFGKCG